MEDRSPRVEKNLRFGGEFGVADGELYQPQIHDNDRVGGYTQASSADLKQEITGQTQPYERRPPSPRKSPRGDYGYQSSASSLPISSSSSSRPTNSDPYVAEMERNAPASEFQNMTLNVSPPQNYRDSYLSSSPPHDKLQSQRAGRAPVKRKPVSSIYIPPPESEQKDPRLPLTPGSPSVRLMSSSSSVGSSNSLNQKSPVNTNVSRRAVNSTSAEPYQNSSFQDEQKPSPRKRGLWEPIMTVEEMKKNKLLPENDSSSTQGSPYSQPSDNNFDYSHPIDHTDSRQDGYSDNNNYHHHLGASSNNTQVAGNRSSVLYLDPKSTTPNFSTPTKFRGSVQFPENFDFEDAMKQQDSHKNVYAPKNAPQSQRARPMSSIELSSGYTSLSPYNNHESVIADNRSSIAIGVPDFASSDFSFSPLKQWKYHIQKNMNDLYLTTNPDSQHVNAPKAPSYYVEINYNESQALMPGVGKSKNSGKDLKNKPFSLSLINTSTSFCEVTVTRCLRGNGYGDIEDFWDITVFKNQDQITQSEKFDFSNSPRPDTARSSVNSAEKSQAYPEDSELALNRSVSVVAWKSQAYPIPQEQHYGINGGEKKADDGVRQYMFLDDRRRKWVVGNRHFHFGADVVLPEDEEMVDYDPSGEYLSTMSSNTDSGQLYSTQSGSSATGHSANSRTTRLKKRSTRVYFFAPGAGGPETDKIMAVLQQRKQVHKQIAKDITRFAHRATSSISEIIGDDDKIDPSSSPNSSPRKGKFFKSLISSPNSDSLSSGSSATYNNGNEGYNNFGVGDANPNISGNRNSIGVSYSGVSENPLGMVEKEEQDKFGWLTVFENVKNRQGLWPVVTALTLAVSYGQRTDIKEKSFQRKMKNLGKKYKEARMNVHYGHRHTRSTVN